MWRISKVVYFMETVYFQFHAPKIATKAETESAFKCFIKDLAANILTKAFPVANLDFEKN